MVVVLDGFAVVVDVCGMLCLLWLGFWLMLFVVISLMVSWLLFGVAVRGFACIVLLLF